jgi:hypothetical protein
MPRNFADPASPDIEALEAYLASQLGDAAVAHAFAELIVTDVLRWKPPLVAPKEVKTIVAYTFGNRIDPNGNRSPGPVNEALADIVARLHEETGAPVYAQWEIAEAIGKRVRAQHLTSIPPLRNAKAETVYLSTGGTAAAVVERANGAAGLGKVAVVGFCDHIQRCVDTSRRFGMAAAAPAGYAMPATYDAQSGQPWTRSRLAYLMHDVCCRAEDRRDRLVGAT